MNGIKLQKAGMVHVMHKAFVLVMGGFLKGQGGMIWGYRMELFFPYLGE